MSGKFLICGTSQISNEIEKLKSIIVNKNIKDIWSAVLLEIKNSNLIIKSTDRNIFIESQIPVISESCFKVLVNAANLSSALKALNLYKDIKITFEEDENKIKISGESENSDVFDDYLTEPIFSKDEIQNYDHEIKDENFNFSIDYAQKDFEVIINKISFAASNNLSNSSKNVFNGIYFTKDEDLFLTLIATNGHRMSICKTEVISNENIDFIVPVKMFNVIKQLLPGEGIISLKISNNKFYAKFNNYQIICSLIDGNYPDYKSILPKDQKNEAVLDTEVLEDRLRRVNLYSDKKSKKINLEFFDLNLKLSAHDTTTERKGVFLIKETNYSYNGIGNVNISINSSYLLDLLSVSESSKIKINFNIKDGLEKDILTIREVNNNNFLYLIMPMN